MSTRSQSASSAGKFETQAQILAKRHHRCYWRPNTTISEVLFFILEWQKQLVLSLRSWLNLRLEKQNDCLVEYNF